MPERLRQERPFVYIMLTGAIGTMAAFVALIAFDVVSDDDDTIARLADDKARSECVTGYAAADRVASGNLDIRKAKVIELFAASVVMGDTEALATEFDQAEADLDEAMADRVEIGQLQSSVNRLCDPDRDGGPSVPPVVVPLEEVP